MILTQRQLDVLNHVVRDGQAWADNAKSEQHMLDKVAKYEASYDQAVAQGNYKSRSTRDEDERVANLPTPLQVWERQMVKTDRTCPRYLEDLITVNPTLTVPSPLKESYDAKVALRNKKPS